MKGYHRSREWIRKSRFSARGAADKSIQLELDRGGDDRWLCAIDVNPGNQGELIAMCQRLDAASSGAAAGVAGSLDVLAAAIAAELRKDGQPVNEEAVTAAVRRVLQ